MGFIGLYELHALSWAGQNAAIGLTLATTGELDAATSEAKAAEAAYQASLSTTRAIGQNARNAAARMNRLGNQAIKTIRAYAGPPAPPRASTPRPRSPPPVRPPRRPRPACTPRCPTPAWSPLTWKGSVQQTSFTVQPALHLADGSFQDYANLAGPVSRPFEDRTLPAGTTSALYRVQARPGLPRRPALRLERARHPPAGLQRHPGRRIRPKDRRVTPYQGGRDLRREASRVGLRRVRASHGL